MQNYSEVINLGQCHQRYAMNEQNQWKIYPRLVGNADLESHQWDQTREIIPYPLSIFVHETALIFTYNDI